MSGPDPETLALYDARAGDYAGLDQDPDVAARLTGFIAALPIGGRALDLGCGPGWAAAAMRDAGLHVTAIDASPEMARVAHARYGVDVVVAGFDGVTAHAEFDGIWAHFSLLHTPRRDLPGHLSRLLRALKPGGVLLLGMKLGTGEGRDRLGRFYTYYSAGELRAHLANAGLSVTAERRVTVPGFDGLPAASIILTAHG